MSLRFGSLQKDFDFYVSSDPAFARPPALPADDASDEDKAAFKTAAEAYIAAWKSARETSDYSKLILDGQTPTKFVLGRINRNVWRSVQDRAGLPDSEPRRIGFIQLLALLARLSLKSIPSSEIKIEHAPDPQWDGWVMAKPEVIEQLDEFDPSIVGEIGKEVLRRLSIARGDNPLT